MTSTLPLNMAEFLLSLLPRYLTPLSGVLQVSVVVIHLAYRNCFSFLDYFSKNQIQGLYAGKWQQFNVHSHRSINSAEGYHHRLINEFLGTDSPDLASLLSIFLGDHVGIYHFLRRHIAGDTVTKNRKLRRLRRSVIQGMPSKRYLQMNQDTANQAIILHYLGSIAYYFSRRGIQTLFCKYFLKFVIIA